jgi:hypothetical protein
MMAQSKSGGSKGNKQAATEQDEQAASRSKDKSSKDHMSNVKAGTGRGAGGGAKQKQGR